MKRTEKDDRRDSYCEEKKDKLRHRIHKAGEGLNLEEEKLELMYEAVVQMQSISENLLVLNQTMKDIVFHIPVMSKR